jgi:hypothetical protein
MYLDPLTNENKLCDLSRPLFAGYFRVLDNRVFSLYFHHATFFISDIYRRVLLELFTSNTMIGIIIKLCGCYCIQTHAIRHTEQYFLTKVTNRV